MFRFLKASFLTDYNIGLHGFATERYCLLGLDPGAKLLAKIADTLAVPVVHAQVAQTSLAGIFAAGNSNGIIVTKLVEKHELEKLKELGVKVLVLDANSTAVGNLIACNDKGCLISKKLEKFKAEIADALGVEAEPLNLAGLDVTGSSAAASARGCLCNPNSHEDELEKVEAVLKVRTDVGTVSRGVPFPKAGIIVNSRGAVVSDACTGPELGRISEVLGEE